MNAIPRPLRDAQPQLPADPQWPEQAPAQTLDVRFVGSGSEYFRIWIVNLLLMLVTAGIYYPFAKVRRLRYFHAATEVGGHPLSFHADPWKLLRGYGLVAVLVAAYSLAGQWSPTAGLVAFVIVALIWPALWHSSLRFRLHNTGWRGLRFNFTGSRGQAYRAMLPVFVPGLLLLAFVAWGEPEQPPAETADWTSLVLPLALLLGLLAALPVQLWLLKRYQHDHYALAAEHTRMQVPLARFFVLFLKGGGIVALAVVLSGAAVVGLAFLWSGVRAVPWGALAPLIVLLAMFLILQVVLWPYFVARLQNLLWRGTRSAHLSFDSQLGFRRFAGLSAKNLLLTVVTLGLYLPFAAVASARMRLQAVRVQTTIDPDRLVGAAAASPESAAGDAAGDLFGLDIGL